MTAPRNLPRVGNQKQQMTEELERQARPVEDLPENLETLERWKSGGKGLFPPPVSCPECGYDPFDDNVDKEYMLKAYGPMRVGFCTGVEDPVQINVKPTYDPKAGWHHTCWFRGKHFHLRCPFCGNQWMMLVQEKEHDPNE